MRVPAQMCVCVHARLYVFARMYGVHVFMRVCTATVCGSFPPYKKRMIIVKQNMLLQKPEPCLFIAILNQETLKNAQR